MKALSRYNVDVKNPGLVSPTPVTAGLSPALPSPRINLDPPKQPVLCRAAPLDVRGKGSARAPGGLPRTGRQDHTLPCSTFQPRTLGLER